jgi:hypothetical protein
MRKIFSKLPVLLFVVCHGLLFADENVKSLEIEPAVVDFGRINENKSPLNLNFQVTNFSDKSIEITDTQTGCGCTVAKLSKSVILPSETISVSVKMNLLGRRGKFEKDVSLIVAGKEKPVTVPIRGIVTQDIWFDAPMIQCFVKDKETIVEKEFDIHTVEYPKVKFDWEQLEKNFSIEELSRTQADGETIIKFRLKIKNIPLDQSTNTAHLILSPTDKKIKSLVIPTACYRSISKEEALKKVLTDKKSNLPAKKTPPILKPERIGLGVIPLGEERTFEISGVSELLPSLTIKTLSGFPEKTIVKIENDDVKNDIRTVKIRIGESVKSGFVKGTIHWQCSDNVEFSTEILAIIAPKQQKK